MKREWLRNYREDAGLTQTEFSEVLDIAPSTYSNIENGNTNPSSAIRWNIARLLGFDYEEWEQDYARRNTWKD